MEQFKIRLNCVDHYQAAPSKFDPQLHHEDAQPDPAPKVPIIRVFGATQTGQKVCAHIHGAFPYIYVDYEGAMDEGEVNAYIHRLQLSIDHALAVSYRRNTSQGNVSFVAHISLVKGTPFYGYYEGYKLYLKVYLLNPLHIARLSDLLLQGAVMKKVFQPYESHLQYILQWMCDYNLYGCDYLICDKVKFRAPVPSYDEPDSSDHLWHDMSIPPESISDEVDVLRLSHCTVEVDIHVQEIANRRQIKARPIHRDFVERYSSVTSDERLVHSMAGLWRDETRRRKATMPDSDPNSTPFPPEVLISMSAQPRSSPRSGWIHEDEYMQVLREIIAQERVGVHGQKPTFESFAEKASAFARIKSALESVEDLYPENLFRMATPKSTIVPASSSEAGNRGANVDVDESLIFENQENDSIYGSDQDTLIAPDAAAIVDHDAIEKTDEKARRRAGGRKEGKSFASNKPKAVSVDSDRYLPRGGPMTASELAELGIYDANNMAQASQDKFAIPLDYTNGVGRHRVPLGNHVTTRTAGQMPYKRRKLVPKADVEPPECPPANDSQSRNLGPRGDQPHAMEPMDAESSSQQAHLQRNGSVASSKRSSNKLSQETIKSNVNNEKTWSFSVVKDPKEVGSARRSGQQNSTSQKAVTPVSPPAVSIGSTKAPHDEPPASHGESSQGLLSGSSASDAIVSELASRYSAGFASSTGGVACYVFGTAPPTAASVTSEMHSSQSIPVLYQEAYFSDERDVPPRTREYAGRGFRLASNTLPYLPDFDPDGHSGATVGAANLPAHNLAMKGYQKRRRTCTLRAWEVLAIPPSRTEVEHWCAQEQKMLAARKTSESQSPWPHKAATTGLSQIDGPTQKHRHGFKFSQRRKSSAAPQEAQYMSLMSLEIHVNNRDDLLPNPEQDEITCVFWCHQANDGVRTGEQAEGTGDVGILVLSEHGGLARRISREAPVRIEEESTELGLINRMIDIVRQHDPDILTGYEVHDGSWGYLIERARRKYDYNLCDEFSRMKSQSHGRFGKDNDRWGFNHTSTIRVTGRHMINVWRAMRGELNLLQYTLENVAFHLLHKRIPHYSHKDLTAFWKSSKPRDMAKVLDYYITRVQVDLEILEKNELISRTSEQARILGVDFFSVFSRGSQFKVESLMFRIAKAEDYVLVSPSRKQVGQQNALECLPLVMEPQSDFYTSPLLVLDFQSLYPSIMIAYNYCYSTFLGRVVGWRGQNKMGFTDYQRPPQVLELLQDHINVSPNGMMYVRPQIRKSLLAKMLGEILETRVMVKSGMKVNKQDKALQQLLNNRQLALKLIANVTYGYTSASFSGRMPCSEIADSIVQTARETLERAVALIHSVERWGAEVVYGDTDSLFVYLKGRSKDQAFDIGNEMAEAVTKANPRPVKLKFEKVYLPCVLLAKKRYVGFKYESRAQLEPDFDAKGIETVRRDGTPAEQKIEETALKILFRTADLSQVKAYFQKQCAKIMRGKVSVQDFCFAKEVRLGTYSDRGPMPPGALVSSRKMLADPRAEPQYGERVPYVVVAGAPGARLIDRCVAPEVLLRNEHIELDAEYYISKNLIPPLERIFNLVGANVRSWYDEMPKFQRVRRIEAATTEMMVGGAKDATGRKTLESYMRSSLCVVCREKADIDAPFCDGCLSQPAASMYALKRQLAKDETKAVNLEKVCRSCAGLAWGEPIRCDSKDCPVFYSRTRHQSLLRSRVAAIQSAIQSAVVQSATCG